MALDDHSGFADLDFGLGILQPIHAKDNVMGTGVRDHHVHRDLGSFHFDDDIGHFSKGDCFSSVSYNEGHLRGLVDGPAQLLEELLAHDADSSTGIYDDVDGEASY